MEYREIISSINRHTRLIQSGLDDPDLDRETKGKIRELRAKLVSIKASITRTMRVSTKQASAIRYWEKLVRDLLD